MSRTLRTARLRLEPFGIGDHAALLAHYSAPQVRRFLFDGVSPTPEQITEMIVDSHRDFAGAGFGLWCLRLAEHDEGTEEAEGELIGTAGLRRLGDEIEILFSLQSCLWGRGLAAEAAAEVLRYGLAELRLERILAEVDDGNVASARLAERLGMRPVGTVPGRLGAMTHYVIERTEMGS